MSETTEQLSPKDIIHSWWRSYLADRQSGAVRGLAARLRRRNGIEILAEPAVQALAADLKTRDADRLIRLVRVLAELRGSSRESLPRKLADPVLSPARFQALMRAEGEELTQALVRAIHALGPAESRVAAIAALSRDLWFWNDAIRARWTFDYYGAPIPGALQPHSEEASA